MEINKARIEDFRKIGKGNGEKVACRLRWCFESVTILSRYIQAGAEVINSTPVKHIIFSYYD